MNKKIYIFSIVFVFLLIALATLWLTHRQFSNYQFPKHSYISEKNTSEESSTSDTTTDSIEEENEDSSEEEKEPKTLFELADRYYFGKPGYEQNYQKAFELFSKSAKEVEEDYCSNIVLANMYYDGKGTKKDVKKALELWDKYRDGCKEMKNGLVYSVDAYHKIRNYIVENKDKDFAFRHGEHCFERFRTTSSCGHATSLENSEIDIEFNACEQGEEWYKLAAEFGHPEAKVRLALNYLLPLNWHHNCYQEFHGEYNPKSSEEYKQDGEKLLLSAAKQGYVDAMEELGLMYFYGWLPTDHKKAEKWFLKAATKGKSYSALMLARLYYGGKDSALPADYQKVYYWANQAIKIGENIGHYYLGLLYYYGQGVAKNHQQALLHFKKEQNYYEWLLSGMMLQNMYLNGEGSFEDFKELAEKSGRCYYYYCTKGWIFGKENYEKAKYEALWQAAFEKNDILAQIHLMHKSKGSTNETDENSSEISRALIALQPEPKDEDAKKEWLKVKERIKKEKIEDIIDYDTTDISFLKQTAILKNDTLAQRKLGAYYVKKAKENPLPYEIKKAMLTKAIEWYFLASRIGDPIAQVQLASMYGKMQVGAYQDFYDPNIIPDEIYWLEKSSEQGNPMAQHELATKYYQGVSFYDEQGAIATQGLNIPYLARNLKKAFNLYMKSAKAGYAPAMRKLASMYERGEYVSIDSQKAEYWKKKAKNTKVLKTFDDEANFYTEFHQK